jgi:hypothetical protein
MRSPAASGAALVAQTKAHEYVVGRALAALGRPAVLRAPLGVRRVSVVTRAHLQGQHEARDGALTPVNKP